MIGKARQYFSLKIKDYPELENEIMEYFYLFLTEVRWKFSLP